MTVINLQGLYGIQLRKVFTLILVFWNRFAPWIRMSTFLHLRSCFLSFVLQQGCLVSWMVFTDFFVPANLMFLSSYLFLCPNIQISCFLCQYLFSIFSLRVCSSRVLCFLLLNLLNRFNKPIFTSHSFLFTILLTIFKFHF